MTVGTGGLLGLPASLPASLCHCVIYSLDREDTPPLSPNPKFRAKGGLWGTSWPRSARLPASDNLTSVYTVQVPTCIRSAYRPIGLFTYAVHPEDDKCNDPTSRPCSLLVSHAGNVRYYCTSVPGILSLYIYISCLAHLHGHRWEGQGRHGRAGMPFE
jgi:hypothetical protein